MSQKNMSPKNMSQKNMSQKNMSQKNMSQKNLSQLLSQIIDHTIKKLRADIQFMNNEVADTEKYIKKKKNTLNIFDFHLSSYSALSEKERKYQHELYADIETVIENMEIKVADLRFSIKEKEKELENVMKATTLSSKSLPESSSIASSPSSKTGGLCKRRGKNLDNKKTRK